MNQSFVTISSENIKSFLEFDGLSSLLEVVKLIEEPTKDDFLLYDSLAAKAARKGSHPLLLAFVDGIYINTRLTKVFLVGYLLHYNENKEQGEESCLWFLNYLDWVWKERDNNFSDIVENIISALRNLLKFSFDNSTSLIFTGMGKTFYVLGEKLEKLGKYNAALSAIQFSVNVYSRHDLEEAINACYHVIDIAQKIENSNLTTYLFLFASLKCRIAQDDKDKKINAFEATDHLLCYMIIQKELRDIPYEENQIYSIEQLFETYTFLQPLEPLFYFGFKLRNPPEKVDISLLYTPVWKNSLPDWMGSFFYMRLIYINMANAQFSLLDRKNKTHVHWNNWSIQYKKLLEAIPFNDSIQDEEFLNEIQMDLKHELIHVYSLYGFLGETLDVMRWALVELEIALLVNHANLENPETEVLSLLSDKLTQSQKGVPLDRADAISLTHAERSAAIERKIQIIENVWTPWLEGLAIFGELTDDPTLSKEIESFPTTVLMNLFDINLINKSKETGKTIEKEYSEHSQFTEELYSKALKKDGVYKLRSYLESNHKKYLPGYLCLRSILSKWRQVCNESITGNSAFSLLLHLTRYNRMDAIPNLWLPLSEFKEAVMKNHIDWLKQISNIQMDDLKKFLHQDANQAQENIYWLKGKLLNSTSDKEELKKKFSVHFIQKSEECLSSVPENLKYNPKYTLEVNFESAGIRKGIFNVINKNFKKSAFFNSNASNFLLSRYVTLPLAQVKSKFWLMEDNYRIGCLVRTNEQNNEDGKPTYQFINFPTNHDDYSYIKNRLLKTGVQYLTITRTVILGVGKEFPPTHYLVYQYGEWIRVEMAGTRWGTYPPPEELTEMIKRRFISTDGVRYKEAVNSPEHPLITRTKEWLKNNDWTSVVLTNQTFNLKPWSDNVNELCDKVLEKDVSDIEDISLRILNLVFEDENKAQDIFDTGITKLNETESLFMDDFIDFIFNSAQLPLAPTQKIKNLEKNVSSIYNTIMQLTPLGWDLIKLK